MNGCLKPLLTCWEVDLGVEVACVVNLWEVGGMLYNYNQNSSNLIHLFLFIIKFITFKISYKLTLNLYTWLLTIIISYKVHWKVMNLSEWWGFVVNTHAWIPPIKRVIGLGVRSRDVTLLHVSSVDCMLNICTDVHERSMWLLASK